MNKVPLFTALAMTLCAFASYAEESEPDDGITVLPVVMLACDFNEGQDYDDLMDVVADWNEWMDEQGVTDHLAMLATHHYYGSRKMDIGWLGSSLSGESLGAASDAFRQSGGDLGERFGKVLTCHSHTNYASTQIKAPPTQPLPDTLVLAYSNCSLREGATYHDVFAAAWELAAYQEEKGYKNGTWFMFPAWGEPNPNYDFKVIDSYDSHTDLGRAWDLFGNGGGNIKHGELIAPLLDCDSTRIYDATVIRRPDPLPE